MEDGNWIVVANEEAQYSIWPEDREIPRGWSAAGCAGAQAQCLEFIEAVWTDMRPLSLRIALKNDTSDELLRSPMSRPGS